MIAISYFSKVRKIAYASVALILIVETSEHKCVTITHDIVTCFFYTFAYYSTDLL